MKNFTEQEAQILIKEYVDNTKSLNYCAKLFQSTPNTIKQFLKERNIHIRTQAESAVCSNKHRAKHKKEDFFSQQSRDMAWLMGFIASDGTIRKDSNEIKIGLAIKDKEILEKIKNKLELENVVSEYTTSAGYDCCTLQWTCEQHKKDLAKYSIVPNKTFILQPPILLERKYWIDYIRGYFDGDGSVNLISNGNHRGNGNLRWQICSATKEILEWIINYFYEEFQIPKVNILIDQKNRQNPIYYFQYSSQATRKIYDILYTDSDMFLKRKKEHFEYILSQVSPLIN